MDYDSLFSVQIDVITSLRPWHISLTPDIWKRKVGGNESSQSCYVMHTNSLIIHSSSCCSQGLRLSLVNRANTILVVIKQLAFVISDGKCHQMMSCAE